VARKFADADLAHAKRLIAEGFMLKDAALAVGVHPDNLSKKLRADGVVIPRRVPAGHNRLRDLPEGAIAEAYQRGESELSLAARHGVNRGTIAKALARCGVQRRSISEANVVRLAAMAPEARRALVSNARKVRFDNMALAAHDATIRNPAVGPGEVVLADALERFGLTVSRQEMIGPYCVDIRVGDIAVEVKQKSRLTFSTNEREERVKYLSDCGLSIVFVITDTLKSLLSALDDVVAFIDCAHRNPAPAGQHWMIRSRANRPAFKVDADHWASVKVSPNVVTTVRKIHRS
jgi:hypothetical protein